LRQRFFFGRLGGVTPTAVELLAVIAGSLAPDVDGNGSITRPGTILRRLLGRWIADVLDALAWVLVKTIRVFFKHRGFIHSPCMVLAILGVAAVFEHPWLAWFALGYAAHLLGDAATAGGIPVLSPFSERRVSLSSMRTGSGKEMVVAGVLLVLTCVCGWALLPEGVKETQRAMFEALGGRVAAESAYLFPQ
jgi:inner membrane protein